jgi:FSR family fosmidomycin resistance protein-like MFS transporter
MTGTVLTKSSKITPGRLLGILTTAHLVNDFYGVVLPFLLPTLSERFELSYFSAGLLAVATSLLPGIVQPIAGLLADRHGWRKPILLAGFLLFSFGLVVVGLATTYVVLAVALFIFGLGKAAFHPQSTNFITRAFPSARGRAMGIHGIGGAIGNFSVPLITTLLIARIGWPWAIYLLAIPGVMMIALLGSTLSEPPGTGAAARLTIPRNLWLLGVTFSFIFMMYSGFLTFLPIYLVESGSTLVQAGLISALMLFVGFIAQPLGGTIYDKLGGRLLFSVSAFSAGAALWLLSLPQVPPIIPIVFIGAAATGTFPVVLAMGSELAVGNVGFSVGFVLGLSGVFGAFAPALTGYVADARGLTTAFQMLIFFAFAALLAAQTLPGKKRDQER